MQRGVYKRLEAIKLHLQDFSLILGKSRPKNDEKYQKFSFINKIQNNKYFSDFTINEHHER